MPRLPKPLFAAFVLCLAPALAQVAACPNVVEAALAAADQACAETGRNQACYGNLSLTAEAQPSVANFVFNQVGDIVSVASLQTLRLEPMNEGSGIWGVALMQLQANLPDTLPGQNVTFLLFGDVELTAAEPTDPNAAPMTAFYLQTGVGDAACEEAPESGLLVQTPEGMGEVTFNINGVDVDMGSTVFFQANETDGMTVSTLEGHAYVRAEGSEQVIVPGTWARIPMKRIVRGARRLLAAGGAPELPQAYEARARMLERLPLRLLKRRIQVAPPLTRAQMRRLLQRLHAGELCGQEPLPPCRPNRRRGQR
ncbi:MAG: hypothetical protein HZC41_19445 [Chloroflexi bacterium]|nr:hypothetical protein [Chloroflexota bacterium]